MEAETLRPERTGVHLAGKLLGPALILTISSFLLLALSKTAADPDLWGYLAFGRLFWKTGSFPYQDVFSYLPTLHPWVYHEWLTGVLFYPIYQTLGSAGLQLLKYALGLATLTFIYLTARRRGADPLSIFLVFFLIQPLLALGFPPIRAQAFTYCFFALTLYLLERARQTGSWAGLWVLVPLQILWCNLHGGFLSGLGLMALYALGEALSRRPFWPYAGMSLLAGLATLINPYGLQYWSYLLKAVTMPRPQIREWTSLLVHYQKNLFGPAEILYVLAFIFLAVFLIWWARWREPTGLLLLGLTLYLGLRHTRHLAFFLILAGAYLPSLLKSYGETLKSRPIFPALKRLGWKTPLLILTLIFAFQSYRFLRVNPLRIEIPPVPDRPSSWLYYPQSGLDYLRQHRLSGNLLTEFGWGEFLIWNLYPQCRVALDGRYETVYPDEVCQAYFHFFHQPDQFRRFLTDYPPDLILIDSRSRVFAFLSGQPEWQRLQVDAGCALFRRQE
jgi:hypothetical protein